MKTLRKPRAHQKEGLEAANTCEAFAFLMAMRTGKTWLTLAEYVLMYRNGQASDLAVIAPGGVYETWAGAIPLEIGEPPEVHVWHSGAGAPEQRRRKAFLANESGRPRALIMNVEALSIPTTGAREMMLRFLRQSPVYLAIDECFPAGVLIDVPHGKVYIEDAKAGDEVVSSHGTSRIKRVLRKRSSVVIRIKTKDGGTISATPNHPFLTGRGWVCAGNLEKGDRLLEREEVRRVWEGVSPLSHQEVLREILLSEVEDAPAGYTSRNLHAGAQRGHKPILEGEAPGHSVLEQGSSDAGRDSPETERVSASDAPSPTDTRRERPSGSSCPDEVIHGIRLALETGARHSIGRTAVRLSNELQGRPREPEGEAGYRVRWTEPLGTGPAEERPEEGRQVGGVGVEGIEVEELENPIDVFDLELEGTPHFFAEGVLVHNSTSIKNPRAKRTRFIVEKLAPLAAVRRILTGLVSPRSPLDVYSQFAFLDPRIIGHRSYHTFRARYGVLKLNYFAGRKVITVEGYQNLDELRGLTAPYSFRRTLEECYDMPESTYQIRHVEMTKEQARVYAEVRDYATAQLANLAHVTATIVIVQMLRMHQVLCGFVKDEGQNEHEIPENRTRALLELLEEHDGKAIVWCSYGHSVEKVSRAIEVGLPRKGKKVRRGGETDDEGASNPVLNGFGPGSVARFWGGNRKDREAEEARFKTEPKCRFMVATPDAGGKGRTWDVADLVVYYSSTNNLELRSQSEERPKNVGRKTSIGYVDLITPGTVEEKFLAALRTKMDLAALVTGDDWREWIV